MAAQSACEYSQRESAQRLYAQTSQHYKSLQMTTPQIIAALKEWSAPGTTKMGEVADTLQFWVDLNAKNEKVITELQAKLATYKEAAELLEEVRWFIAEQYEDSEEGDAAYDLEIKLHEICGKINLAEKIGQLEND